MVATGVEALRMLEAGSFHLMTVDEILATDSGDISRRIILSLADKPIYRPLTVEDVADMSGVTTRQARRSLDHMATVDPQKFIRFNDAECWEYIRTYKLPTEGAYRLAKEGLPEDESWLKSAFIGLDLYVNAALQQLGALDMNKELNTALRELGELDAKRAFGLYRSNQWRYVPLFRKGKHPSYKDIRIYPSVR